MRVCRNYLKNDVQNSPLLALTDLVFTEKHASADVMLLCYHTYSLPQAVFNQSASALHDIVFMLGWIKGVGCVLCMSSKITCIRSIVKLGLQFYKVSSS